MSLPTPPPSGSPFQLPPPAAQVPTVPAYATYPASTNSSGPNTGLILGIIFAVIAVIVVGSLLIVNATSNSTAHWLENNIQQQANTIVAQQGYNGTVSVSCSQEGSSNYYDCTLTGSDSSTDVGSVRALVSNDGTSWVKVS